MIDRRKSRDGTQWELTSRPSGELLGYFTTEKNTHQHAHSLGLAVEWEQYVVREILA